MARIKSIPAYELTETHLLLDPVWQFRVDDEGEEGSDETHVLPTQAGLRLGTFGSFVAHATYTFKDGYELPGAVQVDILGAKVILTPAFLYVQGKTLDPLATDVETRLARITGTVKTRPTKWQLNVHFVGEGTVRSGRIYQSRWIQVLVLVARLISLRFALRE
jgi:hypothetical protein